MTALDRRRVVKKTLFACFLTFYTLTAVAQTGQTSRIVHTKEKSAIHVPPQEAPAGLKKIYSNLGKSKTDLYNETFGYGIEGPLAGGLTQFVGMPFTPKSDSHVSQVQVAMGYNGTGNNQVNLSIYTDSRNAPGTLLAGPVTVTNLPDGGTCCILTVANFSSVAVTGGTQYWVVADTPLTGTGSDFSGIWNFVVTYIPQAVNQGSGWFGFNGLTEAAGEVLGTIP
jgi:hypothetical protein